MEMGMGNLERKLARCDQPESAIQDPFYRDTNALLDAWCLHSSGIHAHLQDAYWC